MMSEKDRIRALDVQRDLRICGRSLEGANASHFVEEGAHEPTASPYFVLERILPRLGLSKDSRLLDVGCAMGRTLAYFADAGLPGRATGIELDPGIASQAAEWTTAFENLEVLRGNVLDITFSPYSHFYLFNPFDNRILLKFIAKVEREASSSAIIAHMSDNGETYSYLGREGWTLLEHGEFQGIPSDGGMRVFYDHPQHYSVWRFSGERDDEDRSSDEAWPVEARTDVQRADVQRADAQ